MGGDNFNPNVYSQGLYSRFEPGFLNVANMFNTATGQPNYGVPTAPTMPSMGGVLSGVQPYGIQGYGIPSYNVPSYSVPGYDVPDATSLMPTKDWWNSLSGDVKAGAWAPFQEGQTACLKRLVLLVCLVRRVAGILARLVLLLVNIWLTPPLLML